MKAVSLILLLSATILATSSCSSKKEKQIGHIEDVSDKAEIQSTKIAKDSTYSKSANFYSEIQNISAELEKQTYGMQETDRQLVYFETSMRMLEKYALKLKEDPSLSKNNDYMRITQAWASKVRDYNLSLTKENLNPDQKRKFESIKANFAKI